LVLKQGPILLRIPDVALRCPRIDGEGLRPPPEEIEMLSKKRLLAALTALPIALLCVPQAGKSSSHDASIHKREDEVPWRDFSHGFVEWVARIVGVALGDQRYPPPISCRCVWF
jgi:hypothetical protein